MCISSGPAVFSNTLIYAGEAKRDNKTIHVLAYQNKAESDGPNAMILPFPAAAPMDAGNIIDTSKFANFLIDITEASKVKTLGLDRGMSKGFSDTNDALVFDSGSYTVGLANAVEQVQAALEKVPEAKRPIITDAFLKGYAALYPNHQIAICCWAGAVEAEPLLWWYEPLNPQYLFIPTLDAHSGQPPVPKEMVFTNHTISVGTALPTERRAFDKVRYTQKIPPEVAALLPTVSIDGGKLPTRMENGDLFFEVSTLYKPFSSKTMAKLLRGASPDAPYATIQLMGWS